MRLRVVAVLAISAALGAAVMARAEDQGDAAPAPGLAYASSFFPVPSGTPVNVRPWDNSAENQRVKQSFTEALNRRGVPLSDSATPLTLNFETEVESLAVPGIGAGQVGNESRVRMGIRDNLLGGRTEGSGGTTRYILRATLDDQQSGQRLWQGEASYTGAVTDETATFSAMAPVLVDGFGETVHPKGFRIR